MFKSINPTKTQHQQRKLTQKNLVLFSNFVFCGHCRRDISKISRFVSGRLNYCVSCFTNLEDYPSFYYTINKLDFPLFDPEWSADQQLLLLQAIQKYGFDWAEIAECIQNGKRKQEIQAHYFNTYVQSPSFLPKVELLTIRDSQGRIIKPFKSSITQNPTKNYDKNSINSLQKDIFTINKVTAKLKSQNPLEIVGYLPKRGEFQVQYDNDAELLLAELQFNEDDCEQEMQMKFRLTDIYNQRLTERISRKQFFQSRNLLDFKQQAQLQKNLSKQQKEMHSMMKVFARFSTVEDHQKLIQGLLKERDLRRRLLYLKELKHKGYSSISEAESKEREKQRSHALNKQKITKNASKNPKTNAGSNQSQTQKLKRDIANQKNMSKLDSITKQEQELCLRFNIERKTYLLIRQAMIRESVRRGAIQKQTAAKTLKLERTIIDSIFQFLLINNEISIND